MNQTESKRLKSAKFITIWDETKKRNTAIESIDTMLRTILLVEKSWFTASKTMQPKDHTVPLAAQKSTRNLES